MALKSWLSGVVKNMAFGQKMESFVITRSAEPNDAQIFRSLDEALEYMVGEDRLRDVITQVTVLDRTI